MCQSHLFTCLVCFEAEGLSVAGETICPHMVMADNQLIDTGNSWDHQQCERCTSHSTPAENPITHNREDGSKCSVLHFTCPILVLKKAMLPVFAEAEISLSPPLSSPLLLLGELFASRSFQLSSDRVQAFQDPALAAPGLLEQRVVYGN